MNSKINFVKRGATVLTADGKQLGKVKDVFQDQFLVDAHLVPDYWLGGEIIEDASDDSVHLMISQAGVGAAKLRRINTENGSIFAGRQ